MPEINKEYSMEEDVFVEFLRDIADAVEEDEQLNISLGDKKLAQPVGGETSLRIYQDSEGTEIGFLLNSE